MRRHFVEIDTMPPADGLARDWAVGCAQRESARTGIGSRKVWQRIAVRLGVSAGTMEGLVRGRTKAVSMTVYERIRCGVVRELEAELARVTHGAGNGSRERSGRSFGCGFTG